MPRETILRTPRLVVTTWSAEDLDALHELHSDPETMRWVRHGRPETRAETDQLLAAYLDEQRIRGWTKWRVADATDGTLVGRAGFGTTGTTGTDRELGYTVTRARWGQGLATEIAAALVQWHRSHWVSGQALQAIAAVENVASQRVLEKVGFTLVGLDEHHGMQCARYELGDPPG